MDKYDEIDSFEFGQENPPAVFKNDTFIEVLRFTPSAYAELSNERKHQVIKDIASFLDTLKKELEESDRLSEEKRRENADQEKEDLMEGFEPLEQ